MIEVKTIKQMLLYPEERAAADRELETLVNEEGWEILDIGVAAYENLAMRFVTLTRDTAKATQRAVRDFVPSLDDVLKHLNV